ncbi:MAG TPA: TIGR03618 family F420-dependent PPOX class oxidoreductase [Acidimicrobiia bacterium]|nr:TIGR03618 family F420-dependent PPOX class oxidoreductase [Acidimicrobiia bacterium]
MKLSDRAREILRSRTFAHVAAVDSSGRPHVTPVWVDVDDKDTVWINTARGRVKDRLLGLEASAALAAVDPENPYEYVQVRGHVSERRGVGADADIDHLAQKYLGEERYPFRQPGEERVTIVIEPEELTGA